MKLSKIKLEQLLQKTRLSSDGDDLSALCPKCGHDEFGISLKDNHRFQCFRKKRCGWSGNIFTLLKFLGRTDLYKKGESNVNIFSKLESNLDFDNSKEIDLTLSTVKPPPGFKRIYENDYLKGRGLRVQEFQKYKIGKSVFYTGFIIFLIERDFEIKGFIRRSEEGKVYRNSSDNFSKMLFGYDEIVEGVTDIIIVEGIFDKIQTDINLDLDSNEKMKCCCSFGGSLSLEQIRLLELKDIKNVYILYEADILKKLKKAISEVVLKFNNVRAGYLSDKDPGDMNSKEILSILEKSVNFINININYVSGGFE